jgi:hypothetical protein
MMPGSQYALHEGERFSAPKLRTTESRRRWRRTVRLTDALGAGELNNVREAPPLVDQDVRSVVVDARVCGAEVLQRWA